MWIRHLYTSLFTLVRLNLLQTISSDPVVPIASNENRLYCYFTLQWTTQSHASYIVDEEHDHSHMDWTCLCKIHSVSLFCTLHARELPSISLYIHNTFGFTRCHAELSVADDLASFLTEFPARSCKIFSKCSWGPWLYLTLQSWPAYGFDITRWWQLPSTSIWLSIQRTRKLNVPTLHVLGYANVEQHLAQYAVRADPRGILCKIGGLFSLIVGGPRGCVTVVHWTWQEEMVTGSCGNPS